MDVSVVRQTAKFEESAKIFQAVQVVKRLGRKLEESPDYEPPLRFHFDGNYVATRLGNKRAIFTYEDRTIRGKRIRCYMALVVMKVGSDEFERFQGRMTSSADRDALTGRSSIDWKSVWETIDGGGVSTPPPMPEMSEAEHAFVTRDKGYVKQVFEVPIYESKQWIDTIVSSEFGDPFKVASKLEDRIYEAEILQHEEEVHGEVLEYAEDNEKRSHVALFWRLRCDDIELLQRGGPEFGWFLVALGTLEQVEAVRAEIGSVLENPTYSTLAGISRRAYPLDMLKDKDRWRDMEKDKDSNIILSDEEVRLVSSKLDFPLFVTGRAGSGKSTMLQYLFSDYFLRYLETGIETPPLYLSYSQKLVDNARSLSCMLFETHHTFVDKLQKLNKQFSVDVEPKFAGSFKRFETIVRECIARHAPAAVAPGGRFDFERHVSYSDFRAMWLEHFGREAKAEAEYGPELSWHVIRSYIKGWDSDSFSEPSDYAGYGRRNKSVSDEVYERIYDRVWSWYRKVQEQEHLWDDQDLIRYCLTPDDDAAETCVEPCYSAIFCDESQDFTRIETELIIRLSIFSGRRIDDCVSRLPFVFAGDEFQTLNPTGFSWASLRAHFTERLSHLARCTRTFSAPESKTLTHNYRSTVPVVKFANRLQLLRHARCGDDGKVEPQIPHYAEKTGDSVYCLDATKQEVWDRLSALGACLIIPTADGQTAKQFLDNSPVRGKVDFYKDGSAKNITIYNPVTAKGLEYPIVAVYGFDGNGVLPPELQLDKLLQWSESGAEDSDARSIALKYFLSNAYVSVTRAKRKLFILTDRPAKKSFWAFALASGDSDFQADLKRLETKMLSCVKNPEAWHGRPKSPILGMMVEGSVSDSLAIGSGGFVNAREAAEETRKQGLSLHHSGLLRQAAARFREQDDAAGAAECEAYAYYYETDVESGSSVRHYQKAGEFFEKAGNTEWAFKSYWRDCREGNSASLRSLAELRGHPFLVLGELAKAVHAEEPSGIRVVALLLGKLLSLWREPEAGKELMLIERDRSVMRHMLNLLLQRMPKACSADADIFGSVLSQLEELERNGIVCSKRICAEGAYSAGLYQKAIVLWDAAFSPGEQKRPGEYYQAKLQLAKYPETLRLLELSGRVGWRQEVLRQYRADCGHEKPIRLDARDQAIVDETMFLEGTAEEAALVLPRRLAAATSREQAGSLLNTAVMKRGVSCSFSAFNSVLDVKFGVHLGKHFNYRVTSEDGIQFRGVLNKVVDVRKADFLRQVNEAISREKQFVSTFMNGAFSRFAYNKWNVLLLVEVGRVMERRGFYLDAARYYEWARNQTSDIAFKHLADIRWIICKERQAVRSDGAEPRAEAARKRAELGISLDFPLPPEIEMDWAGYFTNMMALPALITPLAAPLVVRDSVQSEKNADLPSVEHEPSTESKPSSEADRSALESNVATSCGVLPPDASALPVDVPDGVPAVNPDHIYDYKLLEGYLFRYKPNRHLTISWQTESDDYHVKLRCCRFPEHADFILDDGVMKTEDGRLTPFGVDFTHDSVVLRIVESGVRLVFSLPPAVG